MKLEETNVIEYLRAVETKEAVVDAIVDNLVYYQNLDTAEAALDYSGSIYNWFLGECVSRNQYAVFTERQYEQIHALYIKFVFALRGLASAEAARSDILRIVGEHRRALIDILREVDGLEPLARTILPCAEYSLALQKSVLRLDPAVLMEPILDIGCGKKALLVKSLRRENRRAVGIDQYVPLDNSGDVLCRNWLEFEYLPGYWGSVIAHMSFANHFIFTRNRGTSLAKKYRETYYMILASLKIGGAFSYTPSLPEVEKTLDRSKYRVEQFVNVPGKSELNTTRVTRLG
ncbi:MAG: hypothetical protein WCT14_08875 [Treponemataceae bacterium]